ncbi:MAG TPA: ABC transporter permease [Streptosporangiaceae bacterium]|nr:ABC transporter permease [Streptosporangiaceae bacterium]
MSTEIDQPDELATHAAEVAAPDVIAGSLGEYVRIWWTRVKGGESGALPVVAGLIVIVIYFQIKNSNFLSAGNMVNLMGQAGWIIMLGMAEVFVLLLGEIDLSIGYSSVMGAAITLWMVSPAEHLPWWLAVLAGLAVPTLFSGIQGVIITWLRLPSFVVTLAGLLAGTGLLITVINSLGGPSSGGSIRLYSSVISDIEGGSMSPLAGWIVMIAAVILSGVAFVVRDSRRRASNLAAPPTSITALKIAVIAVAGVVVVLLSNTNRGRTTVLEGVPWVVVVMLVVLVAYSVLLSRTRFGRYIYAIGGNAEAARRSGINLSRIRVLAFALCGLTAGMMGIIYASFLGSASSDVNGGQNVLYAVAAAVIGGTSLFGGRGRMLGAVLGGLIVAVIYNGLGLLGLGAPAQDIWTALVLLAAVTVDTLARRRQPDHT